MCAVEIAVKIIHVTKNTEKNVWKLKYPAHPYIKIQNVTLERAVVEEDKHSFIISNRLKKFADKKCTVVVSWEHLT